MAYPVARLKAAVGHRYHIVRELGAGGMATVYLAEDLKHQRRVAVKVLKPELTVVLGGERFLNEITVTANLQHPHILQLYDSGEADSFLYYVMPYVEGESLRDRLHREGQLAIEDALEITRSLASALDYAHRRGVIHRDIKPENILLQDGVALMADFGIALAVKAAGGERLTQTGLSLGTPAYMSPEQVAGERQLDARSDVYSLACVTYEMLAGDPPFVASSAQAVMAKHVTDPAPPITTTRPSVSPAIAYALTKALHKTAADRYETAGAFVTALTTESGTVERAVKSVVVLPFLNRSADPNNEYFSDGLTEEVISDLTSLSGLRVISRNSAMALKGTTKDAATLARELGVTHLVTGSVRRAGDALRVTAELVEARTDTLLWSDKFSGTLEDVFGIQEEISRKIVSALHVKLTEAEGQQVARRPIDDVVAYDCYLRARREMYLWTPEGQRRALRFVDQAMEIVGESPLLLATSGLIHWSMVNTNMVKPAEGLSRADERAARALALDPDNGLAVFVRGLSAGSKGRRTEALQDLYRAKDLLPNDSVVLAELCRYSNSSGLRHHWKYVELVSRIDPLNPLTPLVVSTYRLFNGPAEEAAAPARRAIELLPGEVSSMLHVIAASHIAEAGFRDEAIDILRQASTRLENPAERALANFQWRALQGDREGAVRHATATLEEGISNEFSARIVAEGFALLNFREHAIRWLQRAVDMGYLHWPNLAKGAVFLESLRGTREFQQLLDEVKPRWEALVEWEQTLAH